MERKNIDWGNLGFGYVQTDMRYVSNFRPVGRRLPDRPGHHHHERVRLRSAIRPDLL